MHTHIYAPTLGHSSAPQSGAHQPCLCCFAVQIQSGTEFLSERTATEDKKLKGKPSSWRLACQTICGNGENTGTVTLKTQPKQ